MIRTQEIKEISLQFDIDDIRVTTADPFPEARRNFQKQKDAGFFTDRKHRHLKDIDAFYDARTVLPQACSVITACQCYLTIEPEDGSTSGNPHGRIARYTWRNYYKDLRKRLRKLAQYITSRASLSYVVFSNGPIAEKPLAHRSGIGYYGKHSIILHPEFGSWIVLGEIITSLELEPDVALDMDCGSCRACIDACPTGAIKEPYIIDRTRCIQELTNWYGVLPDDIARVWGNRLYGCTTCQDACPINQKVNPNKPRTDIGYVGSSIPLSDILAMDETAYRKLFSDNQVTAHWIDFLAIQRNALLALAHCSDHIALPLLQKYCTHKDPVLSSTAQWAYGHLNDV